MTDSLPPQSMPDPADPPDLPGLARLTGRMLLQLHPSRIRHFSAPLDLGRSGLVLTGDGALAKAGELRAEGFSGALLVDEARYTTAAATAEEPFPGLDEAPLQLFGDPLEDMLQAQLVYADAALAPTGYLHPEASGALKAAAKRIGELKDPRVVFTVPIDVGWLRPDPVKQLIAVLNEVPGSKALMLGGQMDPLGHFAGAVAGLVQVLSEVPQTALLRTDLAALGALARGAAFTAFGADSSVRHIVPPAERAKTSGGPSTPHVLFSDLMAYFLGQTIADRFGAADAPVCDCAVCDGAPLDRFISMKQQVPAAQHNAAVLMEWLHEMDAVQPADRPEWWQQRCQHAVERYAFVNAQLDQPDFEPPAQLKRWAKFPGPSAPATVPGGTPAP